MKYVPKAQTEFTMLKTVNEWADYKSRKIPVAACAYRSHLTE